MPGPRVGWSSLDMAELKRGSCCHIPVQKKTITLICTDPDATDSSGDDEAPHCLPPMKKKKRVVRQIFLPAKPFFPAKTLPPSAKILTSTLPPTKTSLSSFKTSTITLPPTKTSLPSSKTYTIALPPAKTLLPSSKTSTITFPPTKTSLPSSKTPISVLFSAKTSSPSSKTPTTTLSSTETSISSSKTPSITPITTLPTTKTSFPSSKTPTTTLSLAKTSPPSSKTPTSTRSLAETSLPSSKTPTSTLSLAETSPPSSRTSTATLSLAKTSLPSFKTPTTNFPPAKSSPPSSEAHSTTLPPSKTSGLSLLPMEERDYDGFGPLPKSLMKKKRPNQKEYRSSFTLDSETNKSIVRRKRRRRRGRNSPQGQGGERFVEEYAISSNQEVGKEELPEYSFRPSNLHREVMSSLFSSSSSSSSSTTTIDPSLSPPPDGLPDDCLDMMLYEYLSTSSSDHDEKGEGEVEEYEDDDDSLLSFVSEIVSDDIDLLPLPPPPISSSSSSSSSSTSRFSELSRHVEGSAPNCPENTLDILQPLPESTVPVYLRHDLSLVEGEENEEEEEQDGISPLAAELSLFLDNLNASSQDLMPDFAFNIFDTTGGDFSDLSFDLECDSMAWANAPEGCIV